MEILRPNLLFQLMFGENRQVAAAAAGASNQLCVTGHLQKKLTYIYIDIL